jgi:hypothetical protein
VTNGFSAARSTDDNECGADRDERQTHEPTVPRLGQRAGMSPELPGTPHRRLLPWAESHGIERIRLRGRLALQREGDACASVYAGTRTRILGDDGRRVL